MKAPGDDLLTAWREELKPGDRLDRFEIRRQIGRGGFGAVYEAFDNALGRAVAIKTLRPERSRHELSAEWIQKEAEAVAKLNHPGIVTLFDHCNCARGPYLVMELLEGHTLGERLAEGPLPGDEALRVAEEMARALAHAHRRGVLHRDLKPANVFLCDDGRVKLLDFGLAHLLGAKGGSGGGTPAYMAPEQARGEPADGRSDVYAAAMVLGETITGKRPVEPADRASPATPDLGSVPRPVARAVAAGLSVDPGARPRDGAAWLESLQGARRALERPRTLRRLALVGAVFLGLGLGAAGIATWRLWERQIPGGRPTVAVADFANETGDSELDSVSGLLTAALEQSQRLRVLTRSRMLDVLRQMGKERVERIDEPLARDVGRQARADALLLGSVRLLGGVYVVEVRALDPLQDEYVFTVSDRASSKGAVFDLVDRLGETTRRRLRAGGPEPAPQRKVAAITTANPKAWDLFFRARQAFDQGQQAAGDLAEAAVKEDPDFALARFLAVQVRWPAVSSEGNWLPLEEATEARQRLDALQALSDRLPEKERLSLQAMRAGLDGRWAEASRIRDQVAEAYPLDKEAQYFAGDVRYHTGDDSGALPYFRQALRLDPGYRAAAEHLADALFRLGRAGEEIPWLREQVLLARSPGEIRTFARAFLSAGLEEEAVKHLRTAVAQVGGLWPPGPLLNYLTYTGRAPEAEEAALDALGRVGDEADRLLANRYKLIPGHEEHNRYVGALRLALFAQGRFREAMQIRNWSKIEPIAFLENACWIAAASGDLAGLRKVTREAEARDDFKIVDGAGTLVSQKFATGAAMAGDFETAGAVARKVLAGGMVRELIASERAVLSALVAASEDSPDLAHRALEAAASTIQGYNRYYITVILGQYLRARGDCPGAIAAHERARAMPWHPLAGERPFFAPQMLHALALCYERTGDLEKARARNEEMLRLWARADQDLPLLAEAKAMKARLDGVGMMPPSKD